jgi:hypothetical protein
MSFFPNLIGLVRPELAWAIALAGELSCKKLVSLIKTYRLDNTVYESIPPKLITRETC